MKNKIVSIVGLVLFTALGSTSALAQDHSRGWEQPGHIVQVTEVHTKDGMFNAYINDLSNVWRKFLDAQKEDLYLTVTFKNWAAFDRGVEYFEKLGSQILGSTDEMREANIDRGELRTIGSTYVLQELTFKD